MKPVPARLRDLPSAILLTLALIIAAERLYATNWTPGLETSLYLAFFGVLLGLALGFSSYRPRVVVFLAIGYSLFLIPLVAGGVLYQATAWAERMLSLGGRLGHALILFFSGKPVPDPVLFVVITGLGFWILSLLAGYVLMRRADFTLAVVPPGIALFIIQLYNSQVTDRVVILAIFVFLCMILLGRVHYVRRRMLWKEKRVSISTDSWTDLNLIIPAIALILVLVTWVIPAGEQPLITIRHAWENLTRPLQQTRKNLGNVVVGLQGNDQGETTEFYGDTLDLGTRASVDSIVYLTIHVPLTQIDARYYWYVRTYDQYIHSQWQTSDSLDEPLLPNQRSLQLADAHGNSDEFTFTTTRVNLAVLVTPSHPIWVSRPSILNFTLATNNGIDPLWFSADPPIKIGEQYSVHANVFNPTVLQLQEAGTSYPAWVHQRYLQLPADLSPQITTLAQQVTADAKTPYDKASAITAYLRKTITYSTSVQPAPSGIDPLVWFLFDSQTGFCNYYATAEVILLRSVGIPARLAVGFAQGEFQGPDKYIVRQKDAHAWPDVYFPGIGWVEFEPTASQPLLNRPAGETNLAGVPVAPLENSGQSEAGNQAPPVEPISPSSGSAQPANPYVQILLLFGLALLLMAALAAAYITGYLDRLLHRTQLATQHPLPILLTRVYTYFSVPPPNWLVRWAYTAGLKPIERAFAVVYQSLHWLGQSTAPAQTPSEAAAALAARLPGMAGEIDALTREYEAALFSQMRSDLSEARRSARLIRRQAVRAAIQQRLDALPAALSHTLQSMGKNRPEGPGNSKPPPTGEPKA